jgi:hypothetical protein
MQTFEGKNGLGSIVVDLKLFGSGNLSKDILVVQLYLYLFSKKSIHSRILKTNSF